MFTLEMIKSQIINTLPEVLDMDSFKKFQVLIKQLEAIVKNIEIEEKENQLTAIGDLIKKHNISDEVLSAFVEKTYREKFFSELMEKSGLEQ